jgi:hypothetical protein
MKLGGGGGRLSSKSLFQLIMLLCGNNISMSTALSTFRNEMLNPKWDLSHCSGDVVDLETQVIR